MEVGSPVKRLFLEARQERSRLEVGKAGRREE